MYCSKCGILINDGYKFCSSCGLATDLNVCVTSQCYEAIAPPEYKAPYQEKKEKYFFGKGALMFCLAIIAVLSVTAGMFIGLYFDKIS